MQQDKTVGKYSGNHNYIKITSKTENYTTDFFQTKNQRQQRFPTSVSI